MALHGKSSLILASLFALCVSLSLLFVPTSVWAAPADPEILALYPVESASVTATGWQTQTLAVRGDVGADNSLALDANGYPHLSYYAEEGLRGRLRYSYFDGFRWHTETVDESEPFVGEETAIALNSDGQPRIAYFNRSDRTLNYARRTANGWTTEGLDGDNAGRFTSLVLDIGGNAHIAYWDAMGDELRYARQQGTAGWSYFVVDSGGVGQYVDIAISAAGILGVSYYDYTHGDLKFATWNNATLSWTAEIVDSAGNVGLYTSLAFDALGRPHISYRTADGALKFARRDGNTWNTQILVVNDGSGGGTSLAIDPAGAPSIAFQSFGLQLMRFGDGWTREIVDGAPGNGAYPSLALDTVGNARIAYYDTRYQDLNYAVWGSAWQTRTVGMGNFPSLAMRNGQPFVVYRKDDATNSLVQAVGQRGQNWSEDLVRVGASLGRNDFVLRGDQSHIAFYQSSTRRLLYQTRSGDEWTSETVVEFPENELMQEPLHLLFIDDNPVILHVVYDFVAPRLRLAHRVDGVWQIVTHQLARPLGSGTFDAAVLADGHVAVIYYDVVSEDLRLAVWGPEGWIDTLIDSGDEDADVGSANAIGLRNVIGADGRVSQSIVAVYYDATHRRIKYAASTEDGWQIRDLLPDIERITSLDLALVDNDLAFPYIAYTVMNSSTLRLAYTTTSLDAMRVETVSEDADRFWMQVRLIHDNQPRIVYRNSAGQIVYAFPTARTVVPAPVHQDTGLLGAIYGTGDIVLCMLFFILPQPDAALAQQIAAASMIGDGAVLAAMTEQFQRTSAGQRYIDLFAIHAADMVAALAADPALLWDGYRTMQNFMPGLEGMVSARGEEFVVTQSMVDEAVIVWQRLATAGSPALREAIHAELTATNNLQDFVDLSFDGWAEAIGVSAPVQIYLPAVTR